MKILMTRRAFAGSALAVASASAWGACGDGFTPASADRKIEDIEAITTCGKPTVLRGTDVQEFAARLRGELLL
jgi:hypothetical protein